MEAPAIDKILSLAVPNQIERDGKLYVDKSMHVIAPELPGALACSTLQGLSDLVAGGLDGFDLATLLVAIDSPREVSIIAKAADTYGRRRKYAVAKYPTECSTFKFGEWHSPEPFIIALQQGFQRVKIEGDDGKFSPDLDYVLGIASKITAENSMSHEDDGIAQRVAVKQGVSLKAEAVLKPLVNLAPYRTFAEIDQVVSTFVFRVRVQGEAVQLALFEGDGGRWRLAAVAAIKAWLATKTTGIPIIG